MDWTRLCCPCASIPGGAIPGGVSSATVAAAAAAAAGVGGLPQNQLAGGDRYAALAELDTVFSSSAPATSVYNTTSTSQGWDTKHTCYSGFQKSTSTNKVYFPNDLDLETYNNHSGFFSVISGFLFVLAFLISSCVDFVLTVGVYLAQKLGCQQHNHSRPCLAWLKVLEVSERTCLFPMVCANCASKLE